MTGHDIILIVSSHGKASVYLCISLRPLGHEDLIEEKPTFPQLELLEVYGASHSTFEGIDDKASRFIFITFPGPAPVKQ